jgi:hypothetical protein
LAALGLAWPCCVRPRTRRSQGRLKSTNKQPVADQKATKDFVAGVVGTKRERKVQVQV